MDSLVQQALAWLDSLLPQNADGHGSDHALRVYRTAMTIAEKCKGYDPMVLTLAALLHDADDHKLFDTVDNANARAFLAGLDISPAQTEAVCAAINAVSFSRNRGKKPGTLEGQIVQDADRLDAMGAVGIARAFAYGGAHGRDLSDTISHFHEKLLLLRDGMNTVPGREMAEARHRFLVAFLEEFEREAKTNNSMK